MALAALAASAQTIEVSGLQSGRWDADTIKVVGDVKVVDSLTVAPGTVVLFDSFYGIAVTDGASFVAMGTAGDSVLFTVADTTGFSIHNSAKGGWNGFQLDRAGQVLMTYCRLEYAKASDTLDMRGGAMNIVDCDAVELRGCVFFHNAAREYGGAINAVGSNVAMTDCRVIDNRLFSGDDLYYRYGGGLQFLRCEVAMEGMEFRGNDGANSIGGALCFDSCAVSLDRAVFADNVSINGAGMYMVRCNDYDCRLSNILACHNTSSHFGGGMAFCDSSPVVYNMTVVGNTSLGVNCNGIFFFQCSSPKLYNCIVSGNYNIEPDFADSTQMWSWTFDEYAPEFHNCLIEGYDRLLVGFDVVKVFEDIIDGDPLFVSPDSCDFRLAADSPCRDAGNPDLPEWMAQGLDLGGLPRLLGTCVDIGAYEFSGASVGQHPQPASFARLIGNPLCADSRIELSLPLSGDVEVRVRSLSGVMVAECHKLKIGDVVDRLAAGVYLVEVEANGQKQILKAVKQPCN